MSAMINFTKELPQNTTVIHSAHTEQYSKGSIWGQSINGQQWTTMDNNGQQWSKMDSNG